MLMETRSVIEARQQAARKWIADYTAATMDNQETGRHARALLVLVLDVRTSDYLAEFDPQGLKQAQEALSGPGTSPLL